MVTALEKDGGGGSLDERRLNCHFKVVGDR